MPKPGHDSNGEGDKVLMSIANYANLERKLDLYRKLAVAQAQKAAGDRGRTLVDVVRDLRKKGREKV